MNTVGFDHGAQEATRLDYVAEVEHARERLVRLERALDEAIEATPAAMRAVIDALQALRGIAKPEHRENASCRAGDGRGAHGQENPRALYATGRWPDPRR